MDTKRLGPYRDSAVERIRATSDDPTFCSDDQVKVNQQTNIDGMSAKRDVASPVKDVSPVILKPNYGSEPLKYTELINLIRCFSVIPSLIPKQITA